MVIAIHKNTYAVPSYTVCYLYYGDTDSIEQHEQKIIDKFMKKFPKNYTLQFDDEEFFTHNDDIFHIGNTCINMHVYEMKN